jgi:hypothetical protein
MTEEEITLPFTSIKIEDLPTNVKHTFTQKVKNKGIYTYQAEDKSYYLLSWGEKPNPGYRLVIDAIEENQGSTTVRVSALPPEPGMMVIQMVTHPYIIGIGIGKVVFVDSYTGKELINL